MLCALCAAIPAQLGLVVIGGEGALVMGGLCATLAGLALPNAPAWQVQLSMALTGMLAGGCWILAVGALKYYRGVNETISSLMMNYVASEHHLPDATITVFQGIVFLTILFSESLRGQIRLRSTR
jgi:simple sugar transport system permease protein